MNKIYRFITAIVFILFCALVPVWAESSPDTNGVEFNIRFLDRRIYYAETDPVYVQVTITNKSPDTFRFKLADERAFSVDFDIRTMTNRQLDGAASLIRKRTQYQQVFFREIAMETGESYSFVEDLRDYANLKQPGSFRVQARIYPELYRAASSPAIFSNYLSLNLRPPVITGPDGIPLEMDIATGAVLVRQRLSPDQVVDYMLTARQQSQWEKFFLYLDLEVMLMRDSFQKHKWAAENEAGRKRMVEEFRKRLQNSVDDGDISVIPTKFEIEKTEYYASEGTVTVLARFRGSRDATFTEIRRYVYYLEKKDNIWTIVNYTLDRLGTEPNEKLD